MKILVYRYTNHDLRSNKDYVNSYRFEAADADSVYFDYHAKDTIPRNNQITTHDNRLIHANPAKFTLTKQEIVFSHENEILAYYDIAKQVFYDKHHEPLITITDPTNRLKALVRNALSGDPKIYKICDATKTLVYGEIKSIKHEAKLFWPLSIFEILIKAIVVGDKKPGYEIDISSLPIDKELLMVAVAILDNNLLSSKAAT